MIQLKDVGLALGHHPPLLEHIDLTLRPGDRVALIGRNGAGKSTLLRLLEGRLEPDEGQIVVPDGVTIACLEQQLPEDGSGTVFETVAHGVGQLGAALERYQRLTARLAEGDMDVWDELERTQARLDAEDGWRLKQRIEAVITQLGLNPDAELAHLSGGVQRQVLLGRALVRQPDLLLLDEPTNHLDIQAITALEAFLREWSGALLFITHDRAFLRALANRIVELDRGRLRDYPGDYETYLRRREEQLSAEEKQNAEFDRKLAQEEAWIRQGIKARRTRNQGRVRNLQAMRAERAQRREQPGSARLSIQEAGRSGKIVAEAEDLRFAWPGQEDTPLVRDLTTQILRGDRIGIIGPNGCGKTTLIRLLLGELAPTEGRVRQGASLQIAYFDQRRDVLDDDASVQDNVGGGRETLTLNGRERHVLSYLQDFLFAPDRARQPVRVLSGGERNRLLLAKLFAKPSNVLVLDEPTNDLDTDTLDLLEERLHEYAGTVLLVSHDREFIDRVVTASLVHEGDAGFREYAGGYSDWLRQQPTGGTATPTQAAGPDPGRHRSDQQRPSKSSPRAAAKSGARLSKREEEELAALPERIESLEAQLEEAEQALGDPALYQDADGADRRGALEAERERLGEALEAALARWEALEARQNPASE